MSGRRLLSGADRRRGRPGTASTSDTPSRGPAKLPEYETPSFPLEFPSRQALAEIFSNRDSKQYEAHLAKSIKLLTDSVRDINDKHSKRKEDLRQSQQRRERQNREKNDRERAEERAVLMLKEEVPRLTDSCDHAVRKVIDMKIELEDGKNAMKDTLEKTEAEFVHENARRSRNEDVEMADADADDQPNFTGPLRILAEAKEKAAAEYTTKSLYEKYGLHNDYIGFKGMWHDAVHGSDGKPLPDASRWFTENGGEAEGEDEDEDLVIAEEHISIICPLSMVAMQDPYTSRACKHTFQKQAISEYIRNYPHDVRRPGVPCPQTGCSKEISMDDLYADEVMKRKIQRAQAHLKNEEDEDEEDQRDDDNGDEDELTLTQQRNIKQERSRDRGRQLIEDIEEMEV
ncbi:zinc-finger of the MIZ type in Nse subunit-domain-containing protein [Xylariomycetidae sp. FL2044]|nr:zinc-finger of the MIZ type in Nse subunit-domain-containing protein [Xylariomycetidae sp. FL2044]